MSLGGRCSVWTCRCIGDGGTSRISCAALAASAAGGVKARLLGGARHSGGPGLAAGAVLDTAHGALFAEVGDPRADPAQDAVRQRLGQGEDQHEDPEDDHAVDQHESSDG